MTMRRNQDKLTKGTQLNKIGILIAKAIVGLILPIALLYVWHFVRKHDLAPEQILPAPNLVWDSTKDLWKTGELQQHIRSSLSRFGLSFAIGASLGLIFGVATGLFRRIDQLFVGIFHIIVQVPTLGWLPFLIILVGLNNTTCAILTAQAVFSSIALNTQRGIRQISNSYLELGKVYSLNPIRQFFVIILPGSLPQIITGIRSGLANGWIALVVVELLAAPDGLGYLMSWGRQLFQLDLVIVGILFIGIIGWLINSILAWLETAFLRRYISRA